MSLPTYRVNDFALFAVLHDTDRYLLNVTSLELNFAAIILTKMLNHFPL